MKNKFEQLEQKRKENIVKDKAMGEKAKLTLKEGILDMNMKISFLIDDILKFRGVRTKKLQKNIRVLI